MRNLAICLLLLLNSCGMVKSAAADWWEENKQRLFEGTASAAKNYWAENKGEILSSAETTAKKFAEDAKNAAVKQVDEKMAMQREKTLTKLYAKGYTKEQIDTDHDGVVSDDELGEFLKSNPMALLYTGAAGIAFYLLWVAKQAASKYVGATRGAASTPSPTAAS